MQNVIELSHIDLIYRSAESISYKRLFGMGGDTTIRAYKALNDISLTIERGKVYGIIGKNGAGKSTLLRILSGVMAPNAGTVERNYSTINLLALGIGFSSSLSGIYNIYLSGMLLGFTKKQISAAIDGIIEYSELGEFIHRAVKTYSSGMVSRLGFAIAMNLRPEVLLIDEVLSVGDMQFQEKSYKSLRAIIDDENTTAVIVTHSISQVSDICDKAVWLDKGRLIAQGDTEEVAVLYTQFNSGKITPEEVLAQKQTT